LSLSVSLCAIIYTMKSMQFGAERPNKFESKDVRQFVTSVSRQEVHNLQRLERNKQTIFLPEEFYAATEEMCRAEQETRGVLLIPRQGEATLKGNLSVMAIIPLGYGSSVAVHLDDSKADAINKFLTDHSAEMMPIEFHTHTKATGDAFANTFSSGDYQSIANNVNRRETYMHVLFTPTNILAFGKNKPQFAVAEFEERGLSVKAKQEMLIEKFNEYLRQG
jgi:hypothetical protein